ncbi:MAG TPA: RIP metalloprotease RseP [Terriglobales bacterium]|jgi:regulator of sigma E protease|nr:RIP metalloprotease RseP [Terriglobales bacterium]
MLSSFLISLVAVAVLLGILVFIHEFGHYAAAKLFGVRVEVFSLGFGKRLFGFRRGDTDYRVSALPLGGYVKMSGENPMEASTGDPGEFMAHPRWQRFVIAIAGPTMNIALAVVALTCLFMVRHSRPSYLDEPAVLKYVDENSPTAKAGLQPNDRIVQVEGASNPNWETVLNQVAISVGQSLHFEVQRGNQTLSKEVTVPDPPHTDEVDLLELLGVGAEPFVVNAVLPDKPAEKAGMRAGDEVLKINGIPVHSTDELSAVLKETKDKPVVLTVRREGSLRDLTMTPELEKLSTTDLGFFERLLQGTPVPRYIVGFEPVVRMRTEQLPFSAAFAMSLERNEKDSLLIVEVLKRLVRRPKNVNQFSGPIGIARLSGKAARAGFLPFIELMALISLNLGVFNLLPIPILDGGLILLLIIEGLIRRDIRREVKERVYQAAFVFLIIFAVVVIANDIAKLHS